MSNVSEQQTSKEPEVPAPSSTDAPSTPAATVVPEEPQFKVYKPPNTTSSHALAPLPDEYFNMTAADVKAAQDTLTARTNAMTNAPLQLRAAREASEQSKRDRWQTVRRRS
jgi:tether containing UBX domain for GLUT4